MQDNAQPEPRSWLCAFSHVFVNGFHGDIDEEASAEEVAVKSVPVYNEFIVDSNDSAQATENAGVLYGRQMLAAPVDEFAEERAGDSG